MDKNACGIISYAGLNKAELIAAAKAAFAQAQPPVPQRFDAFFAVVSCGTDYQYGLHRRWRNARRQSGAQRFQH